MPLRDKISPAPRQVRLAGVLTVLPGLALLAIAVVFAVRSGGDPAVSALAGSNAYAAIVYYVVLAAGVLACAAGLLLGKTWARSPTVVVGLLLIGVGWYATGPSHQPGLGMPLMLIGAGVVVLLFRRPARAWVLGQLEGESEEEASLRGGAAQRAANRERRDEHRR